MLNQPLVAGAAGYKFNPGFQSDEEAVQNFIVRKAEFERIMSAFRGHGAGRSADLPPRVLVIASRGAGKTTLCRRVLAEVHRDDLLRSHWHPIFLGEESYSVTTAGEFFLECIFHLQERNPDSNLKKKYEDALLLTEENELREEALKILKAFARAKSKKLLIIVENFQIILHEQMASGADDLLKQLKNDDLFGVLATTVAESESEDMVSSFPDFLKIVLRPLSLTECYDLWKALTDHDVKPQRIRPLQILTGGSPRLLHILAEFMRTPSLSNLMDHLNLLIDQNTEYFKSHLDTLPAIERKVFVALLDAWDPSTAKQIAEAARVNINTASAMLARLTSRGAVIKEPGRGRTAIYYAAERLFNIYYLMRRRSHPSSRVHALVAFMTEYYDRDELIDTAAILAKEACSLVPASRADYHSTFAAILSKASKADRARILEKSPPEFVRYFLEHRPVEGDGNAEVRAILEKSEKAVKQDNVEEALRLLHSATDAFPDSPDLWTQLILLRLNAGDTEEAIAAAARLRELPENESLSYALEGMAEEIRDSHDAARKAYETSLSLDPDNPISLNELAQLYVDEGEVEEAIKIFGRAEKKGVLFDRARAKFARVLIDQDKPKSAERLLRAAISEPDAFLVRRSLVELLCDQEREAEGVSVLRAAAEAGEDWRNWADYGTFLLYRKGDAVAAREALRTAVKFGADPSAYRQFAAAALKAGDDKSIVTEIVSDLTKRFPNDPAAWLQAGFIYQTVEAPLEAQGAFEKAVESSSGELRCRPSKELASHLIHMGEEGRAKHVLTEALEKTKDCYCCTVAQAEIAERAGDQETARIWYNAAIEINSQGVSALTGLSRISNPTDAKHLIEKAIAAAPDDPRCLLARAQNTGEDEQSQVADASQALALSPHFVEAHLFLASNYSRSGKIDDALKHLTAALDRLAVRRELISKFVDTAIVVAKAGASERVSSLLERHPQGSALEPLAIAIKLIRGENPVVATEVMAVAKDIAATTKKPP